MGDLFSACCCDVLPWFDLLAFTEPPTSTTAYTSSGFASRVSFPGGVEVRTATPTNYRWYGYTVGNALSGAPRFGRREARLASRSWVDGTPDVWPDLESALTTLVDNADTRTFTATPIGDFRAIGWFASLPGNGGSAWHFFQRPVSKSSGSIQYLELVIAHSRGDGTLDWLLPCAQSFNTSTPTLFLPAAPRADLAATNPVTLGLRTAWNDASILYSHTGSDEPTITIAKADGAVAMTKRVIDATYSGSTPGIGIWKRRDVGTLAPTSGGSIYGPFDTVLEYIYRAEGSGSGGSPYTLVTAAQEIADNDRVVAFAPHLPACVGERVDSADWIYVGRSRGATPPNPPFSNGFFSTDITDVRRTIGAGKWTGPGRQMTLGSLPAEEWFEVRAITFPNIAAAGGSTINYETAGVPVDVADRAAGYTLHLYDGIPEIVGDTAAPARWIVAYDYTTHADLDWSATFAPCFAPYADITGVDTFTATIEVEKVKALNVCGGTRTLYTGAEHPVSLFPANTKLRKLRENTAGSRRWYDYDPADDDEYPDKPAAYLGISHAAVFQHKAPSGPLASVVAVVCERWQTYGSGTSSEYLGADFVFLDATAAVVAVARTKVPTLRTSTDTEPAIIGCSDLFLYAEFGAASNGSAPHRIRRDGAGGCVADVRYPHDTPDVTTQWAYRPVRSSTPAADQTAVDITDIDSALTYAEVTWIAAHGTEYA